LRRRGRVHRGGRSMSPLASIIPLPASSGALNFQQITANRRLGAELGNASACRPPVCTRHRALIALVAPWARLEVGGTAPKLLPARFQSTTAHHTRTVQLASHGLFNCHVAPLFCREPVRHVIRCQMSSQAMDGCYRDCCTSQKLGFVMQGLG
jgi:hypothetical protein